MGLDTVELVMEVEDRFEIQLSDEECAEVRTVDELVRVVRRHLIEKCGDSASAGIRVPAESLYDRVRQTLIDGFETLDFSPPDPWTDATPIAPFIETNSRRRWRALRNVTGLDLPSLIVSPTSTRWQWLLMLVFLVAAGLGAVIWPPVIYVAIPFMVVLLFWPRDADLPEECASLGGLTHVASVRNLQGIDSQTLRIGPNDPRFDEAIDRGVKELVAVTTGLPLAEIDDELDLLRL